MPPLPSMLDPGGPGWAANAARMRGLLDELATIRAVGAAAAVAFRPRAEARGMLMPRDRLGLALDPGSPWLELMPYAGWMRWGDTDGSGAGAGAIGGIGRIAGRSCLVVVDDYAVKGATITPDGLAKKLRLQEIARDLKLPLVTLAQSGGANLDHAHEVFVPGGRGFANQARLSALGIPQVTVVHGSATAGGAYQPGLSDYVIMVRGQATMYLAGPPLLKAATGEVATDEALGGAEMHATVPGTADFLAEDDADGIRLARAVIAALPWEADAPVPGGWAPPLYPAEDLLGVVPADPRTPWDGRAVVARIADGSEFLEFKPDWDRGTVCGWMRIEGRAAGAILNNAPITAEGAAKAAQFIQLCDQSGTPLVFLHNTTGFLVGTEPERAGIIKHGSKMIQAVANARVPKLSVVLAGSYGAGNYAMCGRGFDPTFLFAWPGSRTAVMGGAQAGMVMRIVESAPTGRLVLDEGRLAALEQGTAAKLEAATTALASSARVEDDGIIDPRDTRDLLAAALHLCAAAEARRLRPNTFGVARL